MQILNKWVWRPNNRQKYLKIAFKYFLLMVSCQLLMTRTGFVSSLDLFSRSNLALDTSFRLDETWKGKKTQIILSKAQKPTTQFTLHGKIKWYFLRRPPPPPTEGYVYTAGIRSIVVRRPMGRVHSPELPPQTRTRWSGATSPGDNCWPYGVNLSGRGHDDPRCVKSSDKIWRIWAI